MRSYYYQISVYDKELDDRYDIYSADFGLLAWIKWWQLKFDSNYAFPIITIRGGI